MAIGPLPPWLDMSPALFQRAIESGAQIGAQLSRQAEESRERALDRALRASEISQRQNFLADEAEQNRDLRRELGQMSLADRRAALAQRESEFGRSLDVRKASNDIAQQRADALSDYRDERLGQIDRGLDLTEERNSPEALAAKTGAAAVAQKIKIRDAYRANSRGAQKALDVLAKNPIADPRLKDKYTAVAQRFAAMADAIDEQLSELSAAPVTPGVPAAAAPVIPAPGPAAKPAGKVWQYNKDGSLKLLR